MHVTETEWLHDLPSLMMQHIRQVAPAPYRKLRLLAVAYARYFESLPEYADAKHVSHLGEEVAEGRRSLDDVWDEGIRWGCDGDWTIANMVLAGDQQIEMAFRKAWWFAEDRGRRAGVDVTDRQPMARSLILCVLGNPFRPVSFCPDLRTSTAVSLAGAIYADRRFDRLPLLADALEDGGCSDPELLGHLRSPGPHVRGCWAVDLVLGKSQRRGIVARRRKLLVALAGLTVVVAAGKQSASGAWRKEK
jgi:hypothetical protein